MLDLGLNSKIISSYAVVFPVRELLVTMFVSVTRDTVLDQKFLLFICGFVSVSVLRR